MAAASAENGPPRFANKTLVSHNLWTSGNKTVIIAPF